VSIVPDEDSWGRVVRGRLIRKLEADGYEPSRRQRQSFEDAIVISLSGPHAEERLTGHWNEIGASGDVEQATTLLASLGLGSAEQEQKYFDYLDQVARDFVYLGPWWPVIEHVAGELIERKRLSPRDARAEIRAGMFATASV
jgi:hypothetical protein